VIGSRPTDATRCRLPDFTVQASAPQLMAYLGIVPSEHSSGSKQSRSGITKTGNGHVRRLLIEAAWTYRHPARKSNVIQRRAERTTQDVQDKGVEGANPLVLALQEARGAWQPQGASQHRRRTRTSGVYLGHRPGHSKTKLKGLKETNMNMQCVGSRMGNGRRTLESPRRCPATE
jgi:hypothetical protein